jgi:hypothetical protein
MESIICFVMATVFIDRCIDTEDVIPGMFRFIAAGLWIIVGCILLL